MLSGGPPRLTLNLINSTANWRQVFTWHGNLAIVHEIEMP
jgi:hypothetical protein